MAIPYINGFSIRPYEISSTGIVTFTNDAKLGDPITESPAYIAAVFAERVAADGGVFASSDCLITILTGISDYTAASITLVQPNQQQCEAYGYTYNQATGTCTAFNYNTNLGTSLSNESNKLQGAGNSTETGTNNTTITGEDNTVKGVSRNNIIVGSNNEIANGINNASVFGSYGIATRQSETVLGGGGFTETGIGKSQASTFLLTGVTTDASATSLFLNGDINTTIIARDVDSYIGFEFNIIAVRTGGVAAGAVGDRAYFKIKGIASRAAVDQTIATESSNGTITGWTTEIIITGSDMTVDVQGAVNMNISWSVTANFYEIKI